jgi:hypothetical protein
MAKRSDMEVLKEHHEDVRWVMSTPRGRRFMWWLLGEAGLYESLFRQPSPLVLPEERLVYNGAKREFGIQVQSELRAVCPIEFDTMGLEARVQKALEREPAKPVAKKQEEADE